VKWEKEVERVKKDGKLTSDDTTNEQIWRLKAINRWTNGKAVR